MDRSSVHPDDAYWQAPRRRQTCTATDVHRRVGGHDRCRLEGVVFILEVAPTGQELSTGADSTEGSLAAPGNHRREGRVVRTLRGAAGRGSRETRELYNWTAR